LGALNDNIYKFLVIFLLINSYGASFAAKIVWLSGFFFVVPFLLFSSSAGVLADKISKRTIIVYTKVLELLIMIGGLFSTYYESWYGSFFILFAMAAQSAFFGPSKYGIIPELVEEKLVSKANGSMTSFTYFAIILGSFLASLLTDLTDKNFIVVSWFCVFVAIVGLFTSFGIKRTKSGNSKKKITPFFLHEIYATLKTSKKIPHLLSAIFGSSFFLFVGAYTQTNIIPFAMQSLHMSEVGGGYLFTATAIGIAAGAVLAGRISKDKVEMGISCITGFFMAIFFFLIFLTSWSFTLTVLWLILLGVFGGAFLIPFNAFMQVNSPDELRGQVVAAANFFSFVGVLTAVFVFYLFSEVFDVSASVGFVLMGFLTLLVNTLLTGRLAFYFFPFFVQRILNRFRKLKLTTPAPGPLSVVLLESNSWYDALLLYSCMNRLHIILPQPLFNRFPWFNGLLDSVHIVTPAAPSTEIETLVKSLKADRASVCLFVHKERGARNFDEIKTAFSEAGFHLYSAHGKKERLAKRVFPFNYSQRLITLSFTAE
jgi:acyl-[acyl-carrier-protein]-phospholipid O-acyltransferase/long-chain-fatty-acid--[acyl-carrier-protein] ligase